MLLWLLGDNRLIGRWRSDRDRTMATWQFELDTPEEKRERFSNMFGKLEVSYRRWRVESSFEGTVDTSWYQVLAKDQDSVMIRSWQPVPFLGRVQTLLHIHFDTGAYWITLGKSNNREFFTRIA